jgi:hypothetical protein
MGRIGGDSLPFPSLWEGNLGEIDENAEKTGLRSDTERKLAILPNQAL